MSKPKDKQPAPAKRTGGPKAVLEKQAHRRDRPQLSQYETWTDFQEALVEWEAEAS
jgi:hypothetical protein